MWKDTITPSLNSLKTNEKLYFTTLNYIPNYTLHSKLWFLIQDISRIDGRVQSVTRVNYNLIRALTMDGAECNSMYSLGK